ncbi:MULTISPECIES: hypothetical protein, partial [unclassified Aeromonas]|uniref:hypothetical protein n=1 Tax=unclassified Aeromonas TaxID=257493 RepID=UPI0022E415BE
SERVSSTRVRCSINVIARASCMETRLDHRRSACSNFINKVRSRPDRMAGVMAIYNLHDWIDEQREAYELWDKKLMEAVKSLQEL